MSDEASKRPKGWRKFDDLTRKLAQVPKEELEAKLEADRAARKAKRKRKK